MSLPLKARLTIWYVTLFALIVGLWSIFVVVIARADLQADTDRALASRASQIAAGFNKGRDAEFPKLSDASLRGLPHTESVSQLLSAQGTVLRYSGDPIASTRIAPAVVVSRVARTGSAQIETIVLKAEKFRILVVRLPDVSRLVVVGISTETTDAAVERLVLVMLLTGPIVLIATAAGGWFLASRALGPVARMTRTAAGIGINDLGARVPVKPGNDEVTALGNTLNSMLERLDEGVRHNRRLIADASHELQTPLAVMRTELDVTLASADLPPEAVEVLESVREETDRLTRIVRNLLTLARFDEGTLRLLRAPTDLHTVAQESANALSTLAREQNVSIGVGGGEALVNADPEYLRMVVSNLLENAIKYSGPGASVALDSRVEGTDAVLSVADTGPGIAPSSASRIFDRFFRADRSRTKASGGSGLGLAISLEIVEAHQGHIDLDTEVGVGSTFTVRIPSLPVEK
jgi:two-component system OmpR family sensor kinase